MDTLIAYTILTVGGCTAVVIGLLIIDWWF